VRAMCFTEPWRQPWRSVGPCWRLLALPVPPRVWNARLAMAGMACPVGKPSSRPWCGWRL